MWAKGTMKIQQGQVVLEPEFSVAPYDSATDPNMLLRCAGIERSGTAQLGPSDSTPDAQSTSLTPTGGREALSPKPEGGYLGGGVNTPEEAYASRQHLDPRIPQIEVPDEDLMQDGELAAEGVQYFNHEGTGSGWDEFHDFELDQDFLTSALPLEIPDRFWE